MFYVKNYIVFLVSLLLVVSQRIKYQIRTSTWNFLAGMKCEDQFCVGTVIKKHWILTSASCITAIQGPCYIELNFKNKDKITQLHHFDIKIIHPEYRRFLFDKYSYNDIALVKLRPDLKLGDIQNTEIVKLASNSINRTAIGVCKVPNWFGEHSFYETLVSPKDFSCNYFLSALGNDQIELEDQQLIGTRDFCNRFGFIMNKAKGIEIEGSGQPLICHGEQYGIFLNTFFIEDEPNCSQWTFTKPYIDWINRVIIEYGEDEGLYRREQGINKNEISSFLRRANQEIVTLGPQLRVLGITNPTAFSNTTRRIIGGSSIRIPRDLTDERSLGAGLVVFRMLYLLIYLVLR